MNLVPAAKVEHLPALDGLRGIAAIAVFFFHALPLVPMSDRVRYWLEMTPLGPLSNGPGAVHVFFVLSGYVLALTLQRDTERGRLPRFYVRRLFRIHPPYMAAVLLAWLASRLFPSATGDPSLQWPAVPASLLPVALVFPSMAFGLLPVGWSLFVELAMSVLFPLLFLLARRVHVLVPIAISLLFLGPLDRRIVFLRFTIDFAIGLALRLEADRITRVLQMLPPVAPKVAFFAGLIALQAPIHASTEGLHAPWSVATFAVSAGLLVVAALHWPSLARGLSTAPARYFGRISYSFYLVHHTVLFAIVFTLGKSVALGPALATTAFVFVVSVALSEVGWRAIEAPSIRAGRAVIRGGASLFGRAGVR